MASYTGHEDLWTTLLHGPLVLNLFYFLSLIADCWWLMDVLAGWQANMSSQSGCSDWVRRQGTRTDFHRILNCRDTDCIARLSANIVRLFWRSVGLALWYLKFGLWNYHKSQSSRWKSRFRATNKFMLWVIRAIRKPMLLVFRAKRKLMLWYLEQ